MSRSKIKIIGAATQGTSHLKDDTPCQDKYGSCVQGKRIAAIALADGAGSCQYSHIGAEIVVQKVNQLICKNFNKFYEDLPSASERIINILQDTLRQTAQECKINYKDLSCTLLFVVIARKKKQVKYLAGHLGDGVIFSKHGNTIETLSEPERGEYVNSTVFVTSSAAKSRLRLYSGIMRHPPCGFMIMSDGAADTLYVKRTKSANQVFCNQMFVWLKDFTKDKAEKVLTENLSNGIFKEVSTDDCSICILQVT